MKENEAPTRGKNNIPKAGKTPPSKRGMRTRSRILEAALIVFEREGLVEATMQAIGKQAGLSSGSVYRYFADKSEIFAFLLGELKKELHDEASFPVDENGKLVVRDAVLHYFELYRKHSSLYRVWWESLEPPSEFSEAWVETHETYRRELSKAFEQGKAQGVTVSGLDIGLAAELAVLLFERPTFTRLILGWDEDTDDDQTGALIETLLGSGFGPQVLSDDGS